ncbi:SRPBCC family protein [Amycolatopsis thermophila]|uniref:Membrane protein n=1 Tax=Amycolatopsis thermophila TaxID=206084 RepID=A0ABU0EYW6_9PSEU|nr:SRPBCC family protein [Amycolatopsis thermophila]MDQ0380510.1 putative membrane protein [Amycolatopsis thermophila]
MATRQVGKAAGKAKDTASKATGTATDTASKATGTVSDVATVPTGDLTVALRKLATAVAGRATTSLTKKITSTSGRLTDFSQGGGGGLVEALLGDKPSVKGKAAMGAVKGGLSGVMDKVKGAVSGGDGGGGGQKLKVTNIVEHIDIGAPVDLVYAQWTRFSDFPRFMKKVENVAQVSDEKTEWKAQIFWSHRTWEATIVDQVPNERIIWRSKGEKGHVDGVVTFHEIAPNLTRVVLVLEYHPQGLFERTGNIWRAQGRRARLELKHFRRHVMTEALLHPDEVEGWEGEIRDGQVVDSEEGEEGEEEGEESDEAGYEDEEEPEEEEPEEDEEEQRPARRSRAAAGRGRGRSR